MNGFALLAPWGVALGAVVAAALVVLHAITVGRPRPAWLPTARFAPDRAPRAERRLARPADRRVLALRALAALLAGLAFARPVREPARRRIVRVVLADVADHATRAAVRDSVRALVGPGDALVAFAGAPGTALLVPARAPNTPAEVAGRRAALDSTVAAAASDTVDAVHPSLSAALVAARRAAPVVAGAADSIELVIVSPFAREVVDAATLAVRGTWAGRGRLVRVAGTVGPVAGPGRARAGATRGDAPRPTVALRGGPADDALAAALALAGVVRDDAAPVRVVRGAVSDADRAWAAASRHVLVVWPTGAGGRVPPDVPQALVVGGQVAVGAFGRAGDGDATPTEPGSRTVARWADGAPAVVDRRVGNGCVRTVGVRVPQAGDAALRPGFLGTLPVLVGPCAAVRDLVPLAPADLTRLAGSGPLLAAPPLRAPHSSHAPDPLGATLLVTAAALLLAELPLRRLLRRPSDVDEVSPAAATATSPIGGPAVGGPGADTARAAAA